VGLVLAVAVALRWVFPLYRAGYRSRLVMLGDLDKDYACTKGDAQLLQDFLADPFAVEPRTAARVDANDDGRLDPEDIAILERLYTGRDLYEIAAAEGAFPRPRELYRYVSPHDYVNRPVFALPYEAASSSPFDALREPTPAAGDPYEARLQEEVFDEAVRADRALRARHSAPAGEGLPDVEAQISACNALHGRGRPYDELLAIVALTEDLETVSTACPTPFVRATRVLRDHLKDLLASPRFAGFAEGQVPASAILDDVERLILVDLGRSVDLGSLDPPRDRWRPVNYLHRAEWQFHKTRVSSFGFEDLISFAQHDRRYLRAVSRTSPLHSDPGVENHELPMRLLYREALRIAGSKKAAAGLVDETVRIPFTWFQAFPRDRPPSSVALENFLLPGNKEDGADKSRHWNVFGGICLYKSPEESFDLALRREVQDLRQEGETVNALREFIRDMIADLNGIYDVMRIEAQRARYSLEIEGRDGSW